MSDATTAPPPATPAKRHVPKRGKSLATSSPAPGSSPMKPPASTKPISKTSRGTSLMSEGGYHEAAPMMTTWSANKTVITRARKSEDERVQFFKSDPLCKEIEPHRALCGRCDTWVELNPKRKYIMKEWISHRKACGKGNGEDVPLPPAPAGQEEEDDEDDESVSAAPPSVPASPAPGDKPRRQVRTESERKAILEADPFTGDVKPHEVFCKQCGKWIRLNPTQKYTIGNWNNHIKRCSIKRGTLVVTDEEGKVEKPPSPAKAVPPPVPKEPPAAQPPASPIPAVNGVAKPSVPAVSPSRKRQREDDTDEEGEDTARKQDESRIVKARIESYRPPEGLWRRLSNTFRSFIDGFKQGLAADAITEVDRAQAERSHSVSSQAE